MMNVAKGTSLTGCWLKQASGQAYDQTDRQRLAQYFVEGALGDPRSLMLAPFEMLHSQLEAMILREWKIACGIYTNHVEKFKGTARNTVDRIYKSEQ